MKPKSDIGRKSKLQIGKVSESRVLRSKDPGQVPHDLMDLYTVDFYLGPIFYSNILLKLEIIVTYGHLAID